MKTNFITFTTAASNYIEKIITKEKALGMRLSVKKTGCSGYAYHPSLISQMNAADISLELDNGIKVFIDPKWVDLLQGIVVDYREDDKAGLKQKKLIFSNNKESGRCGCGESFHLDLGSKNV